MRQPPTSPDPLPLPCLRSRWQTLHPINRPEPPVLPITAIFALTAGSGKTSLTATLARILTSLGEVVLIATTDPESPLPGYFNQPDLLPGTIRTLAPNGGGTRISLISYDLGAIASSPARQTECVDHLQQLGSRANRIIVELTERSGWFLHRLATPGLQVLIPVAPTMGSVISLQAVERFFRDLTDPKGRPIQPSYVINQFDDALPAHRDVRDFLRRQLGDRLLPIVIRLASGVPQAFAHHMTVVDYAPHSPVSADYKKVADWLRDSSPAPEVPPPTPPSRWVSLNAASPTNHFNT